MAAVEVPLPKVNVAEPRLWSCEAPHLYSAEVALVLNGKVIDKLTSTPDYDQLQMRRLKKRKLQLKDTITLLEMRLIPDIPA